MPHGSCLGDSQLYSQILIDLFNINMQFSCANNNPSCIIVSFWAVDNFSNLEHWHLLSLLRFWSREMSPWWELWLYNLPLSSHSLFVCLFLSLAFAASQAYWKMATKLRRTSFSGCKCLGQDDCFSDAFAVVKTSFVTGTLCLIWTDSYRGSDSRKILLLMQHISAVWWN